MTRRLTIPLILGASLALFGCGGQSDQTSDSVKLQGAGASFPAPLYNKWFKTYSGSHPNAIVDYQSVGSGSGVKSVIDHTVDFGASDAAMKPEDMAKVAGGVRLFPMTRIASGFRGRFAPSYTQMQIPACERCGRRFLPSATWQIRRYLLHTAAKTLLRAHNRVRP